MTDYIQTTDSLRGFVQLIYAETAASIQQLFTIEDLPSVLELDMVRVCCGSEAVNRADEGYILPDQTPWLAELCFGKGRDGVSWIDVGDVMRSHSSTLAEMPCKSIQGVGPAWASVFSDYDIETLIQVAQCPQQRQAQIRTQTHTHKILEFVGKARMALSPPPPVPRTQLDRLAVADAIWLSPQEAASRVDQIEEKDWNNVLNFLTQLYAALDDSSIQSLTLRDVLW